MTLPRGSSDAVVQGTNDDAQISKLYVHRMDVWKTLSTIVLCTSTTMHTGLVHGWGTFTIHSSSILFASTSSGRH